MSESEKKVKRPSRASVIRPVHQPRESRRHVLLHEAQVVNSATNEISSKARHGRKGVGPIECFGGKLDYLLGNRLALIAILFEQVGVPGSTLDVL